jgi:integrase
MPKAKKLPSGNFRVQVFDYQDSDGKKHKKSFTAPTKKEAELMAAEWKMGKEKGPSEDIALYDAVARYIDAKRGALSPSTIRGYEGMKRNYFTDIGKVKLKKLDNTMLQIWISDLSGKISPKTVRNVHGLLASTLDMFLPDFNLKTTLPAKIKPELYTPSDDDIKRLLNHIAGKELEIAVLLAAFGPMRRGEICALTSDDIHGNVVSVNKDMVMGPDGMWYTKQPKTYSSYRRIEYPEFVIEKIKNIDGRIIKATPNQITARFQRAITYSKSPHFRFHDLRHYSASIMHAIGVPDQYIMQRGGWASDYVMKNIYRDTIDEEAKKQNRVILNHFDAFSR